ncbi:hypothetical protein Sjap_006881 [Stephania japonica]|uniref:Acyl-CoA dehydrogenase n=1 Tax=Stephania japonica TaxID=461633 RepID=A0AAP0PJD4_9MAGN
MANRTSDLVGTVKPEFDADALLRYLRANVEGFPSSASRIDVSQFGHGQSNPTFLIEAAAEGTGEAARRYVLRKKPPGKLLQSAHAVDREFQVLAALGAHTEVPVPKVFCLCTDPTVIGTDFYIMDFLEGRIFIDPKLPGVAPHKRKAIYSSTAKTLASLHRVNVDSIGLGNFGRRDNYCKRQVERWAKQYLASTGEGKPERNPRMLELARWLQQHIPLEDSSGTTAGIVHGDFRIDNLVFHPNEDRVIGILDWELSTLGNQMCDVAHSCMPFIVDLGVYPYDGLEASGIPEGIPSQATFLAEYCAATGRPWPSANWKFYVAFSLFRGASIYAGVYHRWTMGNASGGERARNTGKLANVLIESAWKFINRGDVLLDLPPVLGRSLTATGVHLNQIEKENELDSADRAKKLLFGSKRISLDAVNGLLLGAGLSNLEYGHLCEIMGRSSWAPQVFNCGAPDTGNMEVLLQYGTKEQLEEWLIPLLEGKIRSGFAMTEPKVASSDATNIECSIQRQGDSYVINGTKWWTSGAMDPRCKLLIVMGKTDFTAANHKQQSMILVDINTPGIQIKRPLTVFGYDDAPHGHAEMSFENVRVPATNILLGEGRGFEIAQGRLGPGRLHHCMRLIGAAERGMQIMVERALSRKVFGKSIAEQGSFRSDIAKCRVELEKTRLLVLEAADQLDRFGNKKARGILAMAKVAAPNMALHVLDMAIQVHGAAGVSSDTVLAHFWVVARTLRIADGPDEVHLGTIAKLELQRAKL